MKKSHIIALAVGIALGLLLGWWLFHSTASQPVQMNPQAVFLNQPMVTTMSGGLRFSAVRTSRHFAADHQGVMRAVYSVDIAVENLSDPAVTQEIADLRGGQLLQGERAVTAEVRAKVNDKRTIPAGLTDQVNENALFVSFLIEPAATTGADPAKEGDAINPSQLYRFRLVYGPSGISVELGLLAFP